MKLNIKNAVEWAEDSGYETQLIDDVYKGSVELAYSPFPAFQFGNKEVIKNLYVKPIYISASDVKLVILNPEKEEDKHNYKYFIISKNNDLLVEGNVNNELWINYYKIFKKISEKTYEIDINNIQNKINLKENDYLIYVGGQSHFGHWLVDHLPIILFCEKNKLRFNNEKYLTSNLNSNQIESIKEANINCEIFQLNVGKNYISIIDIPFMKILANLSIYKSYDLLKSKLADADNNFNQEVDKKNLKILYLQRGMQREINRVENEQEVIELMIKKNIEIIKPHELSLKAKKKIFNKYDLIICPPASAYFNFYIFSKQKAHLIYCIHESALYNTESAVLGGSFYQCPDLYRTTLIPALQPSIDKYKEPVYDATCIIDIDSLVTKIENYNIY